MPGEPLMAMDAAGKDQLWNLRRKVGEAVKAHSTYKEEDTVVPRGHLPANCSSAVKNNRQSVSDLKAFATAMPETATCTSTF